MFDQQRTKKVLTRVRVHVDQVKVVKRGNELPFGHPAYYHEYGTIAICQRSHTQV